MTELKILTDLEVDVALHNDGHTEEQLRREAIRWIKELREAQRDSMKGFKLCVFTAHGADSKTNQNVILWIKHFFNLTEDDLKWAE